jgi:hypothetical protein
VRRRHTDDFLMILADAKFCVEIIRAPSHVELRRSRKYLLPILSASARRRRAT